MAQCRLDDSEWMRNGDYIPSRMDAQLDAAHLVCNIKRQANVESALAIMTMSSPSYQTCFLPSLTRRPQVLVTLTGEQSKLQHALASVQLSGQKECNLPSALQVAQLILKNRQNPNQRQRIILFLGSPLPALDATQLIAIGRMLKKNGVALDIISFGAIEANCEPVHHLLVAAAALDPQIAKDNLHEALLAPECNCHLLTVPIGENIATALQTSPVLMGEDGVPMASGFGMDDDMDPELAMALKMSLEEEQARIAREKAAASGAPPSSTSPDLHDPAASNDHMALDEDDEEAILARAIALSMETAAQEQQKNKE